MFNEYRINIQAKGRNKRVQEMTTDIQTEFLTQAQMRIYQSNVQNLVGLSLDGYNYVVAWFNGYPYHSQPLSLNLVHNAIIRSRLGTNYSIHISNYPLPFKVESAAGLLTGPNNMGFLLATNIPFAMAFLSAFYVVFYIKERISKAKLLQFVSGLNVSVFWITSFLFDFTTYIISAVVVILILLTFQEQGWRTASELFTAFMCLMIFGFAMLQLTYVLSMFFSTSPIGFVCTTIFFILSGEITTIYSHF